MARTRRWYLALGYANPYRWAHFASVPFQALKKPLRKSRVSLLTTAALFQPDKGNQGPGAPYNAAAKFYEIYERETSGDSDVRIAHVGIDRKHTTMEDSRSWFPMAALRRAVASGRIGEIGPHFFGVPTNRSQRHTVQVDAPEVRTRCMIDDIDVAVLVPNCPICHQTLSLVARDLEAYGIPTVLLACAKDIIEHCGVPRAVFNDFPLGNAAGKPHDQSSQDFTLELALRTLESAPAARTTVQSPLIWSESYDWKLDYCNIDRVDAGELERLRRDIDRAKGTARGIRETSLNKKGT